MREAGADGPQAIGNVGDIRPGDIIQYRDARWPKAHFAHHTAIVASVDVTAKKLNIYQQNANHREYVTEGAIRVDRIEGGWIRIYRPIRGDK
jgi:hypothetical protein